MKLSTQLVGLLGAITIALTVPSVIAAQGAAAQMPAEIKASKLASGQVVLTDAKGMTLYTYAKDADGKSVCMGNCAKNWPPIAAAADAKPVGAFTVITRDDGSKQWAYKNMPLYGWVKDTKPGDSTGDNMGNGAWKVAVQ